MNLEEPFVTFSRCLKLTELTVLLLQVMTWRQTRDFGRCCRPAHHEGGDYHGWLYDAFGMAEGDDEELDHHYDRHLQRVVREERENSVVPGHKKGAQRACA